MIKYNHVNTFFKEILDGIHCRPDTKAYIISIYGKYQTSNFDLSNDSVTLLFAQARSKNDFSSYQNLGDWIFFSNTIVPEQLVFASKEYYDTVARLSYYSCYKIINRQWKLFEELADNYNFLEKEVKKKIHTLNI
jgi:hypothetical protein